MRLGFALRVAGLSSPAVYSVSEIHFRSTEMHRQVGTSLGFAATQVVANFVLT